MALLAYSIYRQSMGNDNIKTLQTAFAQQMESAAWGWFYFALVLMPINWLLETIKWRQLTQSFANVTLWQSLKSILAGTTFSLLTPNRAGEYGGRLLVFPPEVRWEVVISTMVGSLSQILILISTGLGGLMIFLLQHSQPQAIVMQFLLVFGSIVVVLCFFCFYNIDFLVAFARRIPWLYRYKNTLRHLRLLEKYSTSQLTLSLFFAFLRYLTYTFQYYCMTMFFDLGVTWQTALPSIATIYLLQTGIPLPPLVGLLARSEIALYIWGFSTSNSLAILASTFTLWVINLVIPALIGLIFVLQSNITKSIGYD